MEFHLLHTAVQLRPKRKNSVYSENKILKLERELIRRKYGTENCSRCPLLSDCIRHSIYFGYNLGLSFELVEKVSSNRNSDDPKWDQGSNEPFVSGSQTFIIYSLVSISKRARVTCVFLCSSRFISGNLWSGSFRYLPAAFLSSIFVIA